LSWTLLSLFVAGIFKCDKSLSLRRVCCPRFFLPLPSPHLSPPVMQFVFARRPNASLAKAYRLFFFLSLEIHLHTSLIVLGPPHFWVLLYNSSHFYDASTHVRPSIPTGDALPPRALHSGAVLRWTHHPISHSQFCEPRSTRIDVGLSAPAWTRRHHGPSRTVPPSR